MANIQPTVGTYIKPDGWYLGECLSASDGWKDASFPGCAFRLPAGNGLYKLAVNVTVTGRKVNKQGMIRAKVEFVGDGEESTFTGAWMSLPK